LAFDPWDRSTCPLDDACELVGTTAGVLCVTALALFRFAALAWVCAPVPPWAARL
jgi:hypothetical protein